MAQVRALIHSSVGSAAQVEVSSPTRRLEELFLEVVRAARKERLATAGAEAGAGTADFLGKEAGAAERVLEELVAAARQDEQAAEQETLRQAAPLMGRNTELIDELVGRPASGTADEPPEQVEEAAPGSMAVDEQVLHELLDDSEESEEHEADDQDDT
ncbi:MAG: hypothetical protein GTO48_06390 [Xanthomonadales bacterium]|nr:hypothetical protein [Xanthomonadales bacterium]